MAKNITDAQKAKHDYSIHQDRLLWSRIQILIAIQSVTVAGTYYLLLTDPKRPDYAVAYPWLLTGLGILLTFALWILAERDQLHRDRSLAASGVLATDLTDVGFPFIPSGGTIIRFVILLLVFADIVVAIVPVASQFWIAVTLIVTGLVLSATLAGVTGAAGREKRRVMVPAKETNKKPNQKNTGPKAEPEESPLPESDASLS